MPEALGWRIRTWNESLLTSWSGWQSTCKDLRAHLLNCGSPHGLRNRAQTSGATRRTNCRSGGLLTMCVFHVGGKPEARLQFFVFPQKVADHLPVVTMITVPEVKENCYYKWNSSLMPARMKVEAMRERRAWVREAREPRGKGVWPHSFDDVDMDAESSLV